MTEQWRDIPGFDGDYQVSNHGRVKSLKRGKERILKPGFASRAGYPSVCFNMPGQPQCNHYIHRLVALAFLPTDDSRPQVNHKDGNTKNNHVSNLEWCTPSENIRHLYDTLGFQGNRRLKTEVDITRVNAMRGNGYTHRQIASKFGVSHSTICRILNRKEQAS